MAGVGSEGAQVELDKLRWENKELRSEVDVLRHVMMVVQEDLHVKEEQFDFLYASLKAAREHSERERQAREQHGAE